MRALFILALCLGGCTFGHDSGAYGYGELGGGYDYGLYGGPEFRLDLEIVNYGRWHDREVTIIASSFSETFSGGGTLSLVGGDYLDDGDFFFSLDFDKSQLAQPSANTTALALRVEDGSAEPDVVEPEPSESVTGALYLCPNDGSGSTTFTNAQVWVEGEDYVFEVVSGASHLRGRFQLPPQG